MGLAIIKALINHALQCTVGAIEQWKIGRESFKIDWYMQLLFGRRFYVLPTSDWRPTSELREDVLKMWCHMQGWMDVHTTSSALLHQGGNQKTHLHSSCSNSFPKANTAIDCVFACFAGHDVIGVLHCVDIGVSA